MADRLPLFKFRFATIDEARTGTRRAAYAGVASAVVSGLVLALSYSRSGDGFILIPDVVAMVLVLGLSYGTYRTSRISAVALLGLYLVGKALTWLAASRIDEGFLVVVFVALFAQGVAGAFALHRLREHPDLADQLAALEAGEPDDL